MTGTLLDERPVALSPELIDLITEAVAMPASAVARAEVVTSVLLGMLDAVTWRGGPGGDAEEAASLLLVVQAANAHQQRMRPAAGRRESGVAEV